MSETKKSESERAAGNNINNSSSTIDDRLIYKTDEDEIAKELNTIAAMSTAQKWAALRKCWTAYKIGLREKNAETCAEYAKRINVLQKALNLDVVAFELRQRRSDGLIYNLQKKDKLVSS